MKGIVNDDQRRKDRKSRIDVRPRVVILRAEGQEGPDTSEGPDVGNERVKT